MRIGPVASTLGLLLLMSCGIARGQDAELTAALEAWEAGADRVTGRVVANVKLRRFLSMERTTVGGYLRSRPSMAVDPHPIRIIYKRLGRPSEIKGRVKCRFDGNALRIDLQPKAPAKPFSALWDGRAWSEAVGGGEFAPDSFGEDVLREPFGLLPTMAFRDASPGLRLVDLIRRRPIVITREGDLLRLHAPAGSAALTEEEAADYTFWLHPAKGMLPVRWERTAPGGLVEVQVENQIEEVQPGLWAPASTTARLFACDETSPSRGKVAVEFLAELDRGASRFGDLDEPIVTSPAAPIVEASAAGRPWTRFSAVVLILTACAGGWSAWRLRRRRPHTGPGVHLEGGPAR